MVSQYLILMYISGRALMLWMLYVEVVSSPVHQTSSHTNESNSPAVTFIDFSLRSSDIFTMNWNLPVNGLDWMTDRGWEREEPFSTDLQKWKETKEQVIFRDCLAELNPCFYPQSFIVNHGNLKSSYDPSESCDPQMAWTIWLFSVRSRPQLNSSTRLKTKWFTVFTERFG